MEYVNRDTKEILTIAELRKQSNTSIPKGRKFGPWQPLQYLYPQDIPAGKMAVKGALLVQGEEIIQVYDLVDMAAPEQAQ